MFEQHLKCHFLQIELNNRFHHILHQSIKVSLITVSVEQLTHLDIDGLKIFKFYEHPEISAQIEVIKNQSHEVPDSC